MAFTRQNIDDLLAVTASTDLVGSDLVDAAVAALGVLVDAGYANVFEIDTTARELHFLGEADLGGSEIDGEQDGVEELFWAAWHHASCSWTEPWSPWYGKHPVDQPLDTDAVYGSARAAADSPMRRECGRAVHLGPNVTIPLDSPPGRSRRAMVERAPGERPFSEAEITAMRLVQPHLDMAVRRAMAGPSAKDLLSPRELEILAYLRAGRSTKDIAAVLWVSPSTVRKHLENVYTKLDVHGRTEALARVYGHPGQSQHAG